MAATFSFGEAYSSGFNLVTRKPLTVLVWGLAYIVIGILPIFLFMALLAPGYFIGMRDIIESGNDPSAAEAGMMAMAGGGFVLAQLLGTVTSMLAQAMLTCAVFRAVLEPDNSRTFYLRVGPQELWVALLSLAASFLFAFALMAVLIPGIIVVAGIAFATRDAPGVAILLGVILGLGVFGAAIWVAMRFSLAAPMTFAERQFRLFESWSMTKGQSGKLFGLGVTLVLTVIGVMLLVYLVIVLLFLAVVFAVAGGAAMSGNNPFQSLATAGAAIPVFVLLGLVGVLVYTFMIAAIMTIFSAPFANVYKQLAPTEAEVF